MRVLLDTDAFVALMRGHEVVAARVRAATEVFLPGIVVGELLAAFRGSGNHARYRQDLERFLAEAHVRVPSVTVTTADRFARIVSALGAKGVTLPANDIWVAAHAMETGADLLSFDPHFASIDGLAWLGPEELGTRP